MVSSICHLQTKAKFWVINFSKLHLRSKQLAYKLILCTRTVKCMHKSQCCVELDSCVMVGVMIELLRELYYWWLREVVEFDCNC